MPTARRARPSAPNPTFAPWRSTSPALGGAAADRQHARLRLAGPGVERHGKVDDAAVGVLDGERHALEIAAVIAVEQRQLDRLAGIEVTARAGEGEVEGVGSGGGAGGGKLAGR